MNTKSKRVEEYFDLYSKQMANPVCPVYSIGKFPANSRKAVEQALSKLCIERDDVIGMIDTSKEHDFSSLYIFFEKGVGYFARNDTAAPKNTGLFSAITSITQTLLDEERDDERIFDFGLIADVGLSKDGTTLMYSYDDEEDDMFETEPHIWKDENINMSIFKDYIDSCFRL